MISFCFQDKIIELYFVLVDKRISALWLHDSSFAVQQTSFNSEK